MYEDPTPLIYNDTVLWEEYDFYTKKLELAFISDSQENDGIEVYNTRAYGILNSAWVGFTVTFKLFYVLNEDYESISEAYPLYTVSG